MTSEHLSVPIEQVFAEWMAEQEVSLEEVQALSLERLKEARETVRLASRFARWEFTNPDITQQMSLTDAGMTLAGLVQFLYGDEVWKKMLDHDER